MHRNTKKMMPRLKELYNKEIKTNLKDKFGYENVYMVPEIQKIRSRKW